MRYRQTLREERKERGEEQLPVNLREFANENVNGLLRQYFPKGADLSNVTDQCLALIVNKLNHRSRKCLNFLTPHEVFSAANRGALRM